MRFRPTPEEIKAFNESLLHIVGNPEKTLDGEIKNDMSYYFTVDIPNFKIIDQKGLEHFFDFEGEPSLFGTIFSNIVPTNFFFYINSAMSIYSILIKERRFLDEMKNASYTIDYLVKNKLGKIMLVRQLAVALDLDENNVLRTNLTRCMVLDHDYTGSLMRDYTPKITLNFERMAHVESEIKYQIAYSFFSKMKNIIDEVKAKKRSSKDKTALVFTQRELEFLIMFAKKQDPERVKEKMNVKEDRIKQYKKSIIRKTNNIFEWTNQPAKKFEEVVQFMEENGLFDINPLKTLYPKGRLTNPSNLLTFAVSDKS